MRTFEITDPAYRRIFDFGIDKKILDKKRTIGTLLLDRCIYEDGDAQEFLDWARNLFTNPKKGITQQSQRAKNILYLNQELDEDDIFQHEKDHLFVKYPSLLTTIVLGYEAIQPEQYGFSSVSQLEKAIAGFCVANRFSLFSSVRDDYMWLNSKYKNIISLNIHGDFFVNQSNISEEEIEKQTLFGNEVDFEVVRENPPSGGIAIWQDSSQFHLALLKYAQYLGQKNMHEIVNWKQVLEETGSFGAATTETMFGGGTFYGFGMEDVLAVEDNPLNEIPYQIDGAYYGGKGCFILPYVNKEGNLKFLTKSEEGTKKIELGKNSYLFRESLEFTPEDLPHLLRGTYMLYTRDKTILPQVMEMFLRDQSKD